MRTAEHNTGLASLQRELDKFNEDRQGNKEEREGKKKRKQKPAMTVGQTNEEREWKSFQVSHRFETKDRSLALIYAVIKLLGAS